MPTKKKTARRKPTRRPKPKPDPRPELTARQAAVLAFIRSHIADPGWAPSVREIGEHFGISSPNGVLGHLRALETKGYIRRGQGGESRALAVVEGKMMASFDYDPYYDDYADGEYDPEEWSDDDGDDNFE